MTTPQNESPAVATRRLRLQQWILQKFEGQQVKFIADCATRGYEINQGELSGLLNKKSFGEKKARSIEIKANMPLHYLNGKDVTYEAPSYISNIQSPSAQYGWPFKSPTLEQWHNTLTPADRDAIEAMAAALLSARLNATHQTEPATNKSAAA